MQDNRAGTTGNLLYWSIAVALAGLLFVFLFIASHAVGQGAVIWIIIAEIFPNNVRAKGQPWVAERIGYLRQ